MFLHENSDLCMEEQPVRDVENLAVSIEETSGSTKYNESWANAEKQTPDREESCYLGGFMHDISEREQSIEDFLQRSAKSRESDGTIAKYVCFVHSFVVFMILLGIFNELPQSLVIKEI